MNRFLTNLMMTRSSHVAAVPARRTSPVAAFESLEARQFFSASPVVHHVVEVHSAAPAVHASAKAGESQVTPVAIWNVNAHVDGVKGDRKFYLLVLSDSNGVVSARIAGDGLGLKDTAISGTHDDAGYHFAVTTAKASLDLNGAVGSDGKLVGTFTLSREGRTMKGSFSATPVPVPAPKPPPAPKPDKKTSDGKGAAVKYSVLRKFAGMLKVDGSDKYVAMNAQLCVTSTGVSMVIVQCEAFHVKTFVLMGPKDGDSYSFSGKGEHGTASINFTVSGDSMSGSISRTDDGKTVAGDFKLTVHA
jgi:hypothetical protein